MSFIWNDGWAMETTMKLSIMSTFNIRTHKRPTIASERGSEEVKSRESLIEVYTCKMVLTDLPDYIEFAQGQKNDSIYF